MRYHWGLGIGHTYSHDRDVRSQKYSTASSTCEADGHDGPEEEDRSDSSTQADKLKNSGGTCDKGKQNESTSDVRLQVSEPEPEDSTGESVVAVNSRRTQAIASDSNAGGPEEEDPSASDSFTQADNVSAGVRDKEKHNLNERNERLLEVSDPEPEDTVTDDSSDAYVNSRTVASDSNANTASANDDSESGSESDGDSKSSGSVSSNSDDWEDTDDDEGLELYHTYHPNLK